MLLMLTHKDIYSIKYTQHPVVLYNHRASMYFCVVVSKECPRWAYSSLVNANPVCARVFIVS